MSKLVKLTSVSALSTATLAYLYYNNQYYFNKSQYKHIDDKVVSIVDRKIGSGLADGASTANAHVQQQQYPSGEYTTRNRTEVMKDIWNDSVRTGISWLYSLV